MSRDIIEASVKTNPVLKQLCQRVVACVQTETPEHIPNRETVHSGRMAVDKVGIRLVGFESGDVARHHEGCTGEQLEMPFTTQKSPLTQQPTVVYWKSATPSWFMEMVTESAVSHQMDRMPEQIYAEQGSHAFEYLAPRLNNEIRVDGQRLPSNVELQQRQAHLVATRQAGNGRLSTPLAAPMPGPQDAMAPPAPVVAKARGSPTVPQASRPMARPAVTFTTSRARPSEATTALSAVSAVQPRAAAPNGCGSSSAKAAALPPRTKAPAVKFRQAKPSLLQAATPPKRPSPLVPDSVQAKR